MLGSELAEPLPGPAVAGRWPLRLLLRLGGARPNPTADCGRTMMGGGAFRRRLALI